MTQQELKQTLSKNNFLKSKIDTFVEKGNLNTMMQRMDFYILHKTETFPNRFCLKIGKVNDQYSDFNNREQAQEFRTIHLASIDRMITSLLKSKIMMLKLQGKMNLKSHGYYLEQELKKVVDIYRNKI